MSPAAMPAAICSSTLGLTIQPRISGAQGGQRVRTGAVHELFEQRQVVGNRDEQLAISEAARRQCRDLYLVTKLRFVTRSPKLQLPETGKGLADPPAETPNDPQPLLHGYVILENHLHLIAQSPGLDKDVQRFKSFTAKRLIEVLELPARLLVDCAALVHPTTPRGPPGRPAVLASRSAQ